MQLVRRFSAMSLLAVWAGGLCLAQVSFRQPSADGPVEERNAVVIAAQTPDPAERVRLLDEFVAQHPDSPNRPFALYNILISGKDAGRHEQTLEAGRQLLEWAPDDLEVRHRVNEAYVGLKLWDELRPSIDLTKPLAKAQATEAGFPGEYASGVLDWLAWAANMAYVDETAMEKKIGWLELIRTEYPESEYAENMYGRYIQSYEQGGDRTNALAWTRKAIEAGVEDESYRYMLAEDALGKQDLDAAQAHAGKALEIIAAKPKPEGMADDQWAAYQARMTAYANFAAGRSWAGRNTADGYRAARTHLLQAAEFIKGEGGERYNMLAYYLGVCYAQPGGRSGDMQEALKWMTEAANTPGPLQQQAKADLVKIRAAI
jgi:hypothetical protein